MQKNGKLQRMYKSWGPRNKSWALSFLHFGPNTFESKYQIQHYNNVAYSREMIELKK